MKKLESKTIIEHRTVVSGLFCDLCKKQSPSNYGWTRENFDVSDTTVQMRSGTSYPECSDIETVSFDICPECFKSKLIPWLESQGAEATEEDESW